MFLAALQQGPQRFDDGAAWSAHLQALGIHREHSVRSATEGALIGSLVHHGFPPQLVILSDDAGQFNVWQHALCWIHAERVFRRILPLNEHNAQALEAVQTELWSLYADLKDYRQTPTAEAKEAITAHFQHAVPDQNHVPDPQSSAQASGAEIRRNCCWCWNDRTFHCTITAVNGIFASMSSNEKSRAVPGPKKGRRCRDTFASLKKTCQKQKLSFWNYLMDRLTLTHAIPALHDLVCGKAFPP